VGGTSLSGHPTALRVLDLDHMVTVTPAITQSGPEASSGDASNVAGPGAVTDLTFTDAVSGPVLSINGNPTPVRSVTVQLHLVRPPAPSGPDTFTGTVSLVTDNGTLRADVTGEAIFDQQVWRLRGRSDLRAGLGVLSGAGGFVADLDTGSSSAAADDRITWDLDALITPA
jgi:hypothetical protein